MYKFTVTVFLLGLLLLLPLLFNGCDGNDNGGPFVLGDCQLDDQDCRLR